MLICTCYTGGDAKCGVLITKQLKRLPPHILISVYTPELVANVDFEATALQILLMLLQAQGVCSHGSGGESLVGVDCVLCSWQLGT